MTSAIDSTKPTSGTALTSDVRSNFATAASEITDLQNGVIPGLSASSGSSLVGFIQSGTGAVATSVQTELRGLPLNAKIDFGATGDGSTDDTAALQAAIDAAITAGKKLIIPVGVYSISSPLFIYKWSGSAFSYVSCEIEGEKYNWVDELAGSINSTRIVPTFKTTFAIGIQNGRGVRIKDVTLFGLNAISLSSDYHEMMTNSTFVTASCRDSRYSPYAGICIDPFGTSAPPDGGYPGLSAYYVASAAGSSRIFLDGVICKNFVCGTVISPNATTQNAENITFLNCSMFYGKTGVSVCQSQSRDVVWIGGDNSFNLYCFEGNNYGSQQGASPNIFGCNMSGKYLFNVWNRGSQAQVFTGIYAETFASIGFLGGGAASTSDTFGFNGCSFHFYDFGGIFPDNHMIAQGGVAFNSCEMTQSPGTYIQPLRLFHRNGAMLKFINTSIGPAIQSEFWLAPSEGTGGLEFTQLDMDMCMFNDGGGRGNSTGQSSVSMRNVNFSAANLDKSIAPSGATYRLINGTATDINFVGGARNGVSLGTVTVTTGSNGTATFTVADGTIVRTGDMVYTSTASNVENYAGSTFSTSYICLGMVSNVSTNDITISGWPQSLVTGSFALEKVWWSRFHQASVGDTHTNTTIDNVTNPSSWANGNAIKGSGIPSGSYIVSGGGTATLTISKATTSSLTGTRLYDADIYKLTGTAV